VRRRVVFTFAVGAMVGMGIVVLLIVLRFVFDRLHLLGALDLMLERIFLGAGLADRMFTAKLPFPFHRRVALRLNALDEGVVQRINL
jgi:hypothetical protein